LERTWMNEREVKRAGVFRRVEDEAMKLVEAAEVLGLSYRQTKRLYRMYSEKGIKGLVHGSTGKPSNQAKPAKFRRRVLALVRKHYGGNPGERFGPTLASEHLAEDHQVMVDRRQLELLAVLPHGIMLPNDRRRWLRRSAGGEARAFSVRVSNIRDRGGKVGNLLLVFHFSTA